MGLHGRGSAVWAWVEVNAKLQGRQGSGTVAYEELIQEGQKVKMF